MEAIKSKIKAVITEHFLPESAERIYNYVINRYSESWRAFHTIKHLGELFKALSIDRMDSLPKNVIHSYTVLNLAIIYHDIIYYSWRNDNEEASAEQFKMHWNKHSKTKDMTTLRDVTELILQTKKHDGTSELAKEFNRADMAVLSTNITGLLQWEKEIYHEYNFAPTDAYKKARLEFLDKHDNEYSPQIGHLKDYVSDFRPRVGYYAGSFNPLHIGHLSIIEQAKTMFDKVVIVVAQNPQKDITPDEYLNKLSADIFDTLGSIEVVILPKNKYLPELLKERSELEDVFLIRGVRNIQDWAAENNQAQYMKAVWEDLQFVYLACPKELEHISSSGIRQMNSIQNGSGNIYIPKKIVKY